MPGHYVPAGRLDSETEILLGVVSPGWPFRCRPFRMAANEHRPRVMYKPSARWVRPIRALAHRRLLVTAAGVLLLGSATQARAQQSDTPVIVAVTCDCDRSALQKALPFVTIAADDPKADVIIVVSKDAARSSIAARGAGRFAGSDRTITYETQASSTPETNAADLARFLKLVLAEYAAESSVGSQLDVTFKPPAAASQTQPLQQDQKDPWNYWIFRLSANTNMNGEASSSDRNYNLSASANRTTEQWKLRLSAYRSLSKSSFDLDETTTIKSRYSEWSTEALAVRSLGARWSLGVTSSVVGSSYSNVRRIIRIDPGIEFDWFPYSESSKRSLTFIYAVGPARYEYLRETIFSKLEETVWQHSLRSSLGVRQPWGSAGASAQFFQHLSSPDRTRLAFNANISFRILSSLTLSTSGSYTRIRDQFTLEKGDATDEEVLLRQRQLATGYRYSFSVGFSYAFGSLSNSAVNPRFGGGLP
jgi:hypothetical protein